MDNVINLKEHIKNVVGKKYKLWYKDEIVKVENVFSKMNGNTEIMVVKLSDGMEFFDTVWYHLVAKGLIKEIK